MSRPAWPVGGSCAGLADAVEEFARFVRQYADAVADACPPAAALAPMNPEKRSRQAARVRSTFRIWHHNFFPSVGVTNGARIVSLFW